MLAELTSNAAQAAAQVQVSAAGQDWGGWHGSGGPGWWLIFPIVFWIVVISVVGYLLHRGSAGQSARRNAERTLAERYARGEISDDELKQRRSVLRGRS